MDKANDTRPCLPVRIVRFYADGFRAMTVGRKLWALIIIKVVILMCVFKLWLMPDVLKTRYDNDADRARAVRSALIDQTEKH
ncbi:MAG: DUF4492 domain-containing protein [Muribaculaceae bacterium]|nr:DUF4492 domain-containing protein [Muribaculaceae bacterium]